MSTITTLKTEFSKVSENQPRIFQSPGRINLIGDHTDYNMGWVLPAAIDRYVTMAIASNDKNHFSVKALDIDESLDHTLQQSDAQVKEHWSSYFIGVTALLQSQGVPISGFDCVFSSNIPLGAGLSSSAAICCCFAYALNELFNGGLSRTALVKLAQQTEHDYVGLQCGSMDQTASLFGKKDHILKIDCQSQTISYSKLKLPDYTFIICDSQVKHSLASSGYNDRKKECDLAVEFFEVSSLRDITSKMLLESTGLDPIVRKRVEFVLAENNRVITGSELLERGSFDAFGELIYASHAGLSRTFEVSCEEMDYLVELTYDMPYVLGSRMMGGGFGGCTINLVKSAHADEFKEKVTSAYTSKFGQTPRMFQMKVSNGTQEVYA